MNSAVESVKKILLTMLLALGVGAIIILVIGQNPIEAYAALIKGAFVGEKSIWHNFGKFNSFAFDYSCICLGGKSGSF